MEIILKIVFNEPKKEIILYDNYSFLKQIQQVQNRTFDKNKKTWTIPYNAAILAPSHFLDLLLKGGNKHFIKYYKTRLRKNVLFEKILNASNEEIIELSKQRDVDDFLYVHQKRAVLLSDVLNYNIFADTGTGKTLMSLSIINRIQKKKKEKWLILSMKYIVGQAWTDDRAQFFPNLKFFYLSTKNKKKFKDINMDDYDAIVTNYELYRNMSEEIDPLINCLILDESIRIKNPKAKTTKKVHALVEKGKIKRSFLLSGKPSSKSPEDYWSQLYVTNSALLGNNFFFFRSKYFQKKSFEKTLYTKEGIAKKTISNSIFTSYSGTNIKIAEKIRKCSYFISKKDCLDLPERVFLTRMFSLSPQKQKEYKSIQEGTLEFKDLFLYDPKFFKGEDLYEIDNKTKTFIKHFQKDIDLVRHLRMSQYANGFIGSLDSKNNPEMELETHTEKINLLKEIFETEIIDKQVVIWSKFRYNHIQIEKMLKKQKISYAKAFTGVKNISQELNDFKSGKKQVLVASVASVGTGITLTNCSYAIYYSLTSNYDHYYQSLDRIYRIGQKNVCTYIYLLTKDTKDEENYYKMNKKGSKIIKVENLSKKSTKFLNKYSKIHDHEIS